MIIHDHLKDHVPGGPCPVCQEGFPKRCGCGGTIHREEVGGVGHQRCDGCGQAPAKTIAEAEFQVITAADVGKLDVAAILGPPA